MVRLETADGINVLYKDDVRLMSDSDHDVGLMRDFAEKAKGRVLITGLGLGKLASMLTDCEVVIVENDQEVLDWFPQSPYYSPDFEVVFADADDVQGLKALGPFDACFVNHYLRSEQHDPAYLDALREFIPYVDGYINNLLRLAEEWRREQHG